MCDIRSFKKLAMTLLAALLPAGLAGASEPASVAEQMGGLQKMCVDTQEARTQRHAHQPLYDRLGGYDRIHELTTEIVRLHHRNDAIREMFVGVDSARLAKHVADFMAAGTGGQATYTGRPMPAAHQHLHLTDADFLAAGGDIVTAMQSFGYDQDEIDEVVCILVSLKHQVVLE